MPDYSSQERWIDTGNGRLYARCWAPDSQRADEAAPIVLFHDSLGCVALWRDFPELLASATGRFVIAYDRLGFGRSDPHPGALRPTFIHDEAREGFRAVREAFGMDTFIAFGHSVGGGMAVGCAATYREHCVALITESAQAFVEDRTIRGIEEAREAFRMPGQLERLEKYHGDKAEWVLRAWIDTWLADNFATWNLDNDLVRITCPVLAIHGDQDEYGSVRHPERIAAATRGTKAILEGYGHVPHREQPAVVLDLLVAWLDRSLPRSSPTSPPVIATPET